MKQKGVKTTENAENIEKELNELKEMLKKKTKIANSIFEINQETFDEVFTEIKDFGCDYEYFIGCIKYSMKIRPKKIKYFRLLLSTLSKQLSFIPSFTFKVHEDQKQTNPSEVEEAIINDDVDKFIKLSSSPDFNPKYKRDLQNDEPIFNVLSYKYGFYRPPGVSYMQIMSFYGSIKCFKFALLDESFDEKNLSYYAVAGGNIEIIRLLDNRNVQFDDCLNIAIQFHHNDILEWILNKYEIKSFEIKCAVKFYNDEVFLKYFKETQEEAEDTFCFACQKGNVELVKYLFKKFSIDINKYISDIEPFEFIDYNENGTSLHFACMSNSLELVKYLVEECKVNIKITKNNSNVQNSRTPLHISCEIGNLEISKYLIGKCGFSIIKSDILKNETPKQKACRSGNLELVKYVYKMEEKQRKMGFKDIKYFSPVPELIYAIRSDNIDIVKFLLDNNYVENNILTIKQSFMIAIDKGNADIVEVLAKHFTTAKCSFDLNDLFEISIRTGNIKIIKIMIEHLKLNFFTKNLNASPEIIKYLKQKSVMHKACKQGNFDLVRHLIEDEDYDPNQMYNNKTTVEYACHSNNTELVKYLFSKSSKLLPSFNDFIMVCENGNIELYEYFDKMPDVNHINRIRKIEEIGVACLNGNYEIVKYIIENTDKDTIFALIVGGYIFTNAIKSENIDLLRYLILKFNKNPELCEEKIMEEENYEILEEIIANIEEEFKRTKKNFLPNIEPPKQDINYYVKIIAKEFGIETDEESLKSISNNGLLEFIKKAFECVISRDDTIDEETLNNVRTIIQNFIDFTDPDEFMYYVFIACSKGNLTLLKYMNEKLNEPMELYFYEGHSILYYACIKGDLEMVKYLIEECHLDLSELNDDLDIKKICKKRKFDILEYLVKNGIVCTQGNTDFGEALCNECKNNHLDAVKYLIEILHVDAGQKGQKEISPLNIAAKAGNISIVKYLMNECHQDPNDQSDDSILSYSIQSCNLSFFKNLVEDCKLVSLINEKNALTACKWNNIDVLKYLVNEQHLDISNQLKDCLKYAIERKSLSIIKFLHMECNLCDNSFETLNYAISCSSFPVIQYLIEEYHSDINGKDINGNTLLHTAVRNHSLRVVKYIVEQLHFDINLLNNKNKRATDISKGCIKNYLSSIYK